MLGKPLTGLFKTLNKILLLEDYEVTFAPNGQDALEFTFKEKINYLMLFQVVVMIILQNLLIMMNYY